MSPAACRIIFGVGGVILMLIAIFGERIRQALDFPPGAPYPGFGPTQWALLIIGAVIVAAGILFSSQISNLVGARGGRSDRDE